MSTDQTKHPKQLWVELLADADRLRRAREAAAILESDPPARGAAFLRCLFPYANLMAPAGGTISEMISFLAGRLGWQAWPASLDGPKVGDIFVITENRRPNRMGAVVKVSTDSGFFVAAEHEQESDRGRRVEVGEVDFWLRLPGA